MVYGWALEARISHMHGRCSRCSSVTIAVLLTPQMFPFRSDNGSLFFIFITTGVLIRVACKNNSRRHSSQNRKISKERTELSETLQVNILITYNFRPQPSSVSSAVLLPRLWQSSPTVAEISSWYKLSKYSDLCTPEAEF